MVSRERRAAFRFRVWLFVPLSGKRACMGALGACIAGESFGGKTIFGPGTALRRRNTSRNLCPAGVKGCAGRRRRHESDAVGTDGIDAVRIVRCGLSKGVRTTARPGDSSVGEGRLRAVPEEGKSCEAMSYFGGGAHDTFRNFARRPKAGSRGENRFSPRRRFFFFRKTAVISVFSS